MARIDDVMNSAQGYYRALRNVATMPGAQAQAALQTALVNYQNNLTEFIREIVANHRYQNEDAQDRRNRLLTEYQNELRSPIHLTLAQEIYHMINGVPVNTTPEAAAEHTRAFLALMDIARNIGIVFLQDFNWEQAASGRMSVPSKPRRQF